MKKKTKLWATLPVVAAALALGGCGGGGDDSDATIVGGTTMPVSSGSITACFTADYTVNYQTTGSNVPAGVDSEVSPQGDTFQSSSTTVDYWYASGYGLVQQIGTNGTVTVNGEQFTMQGTWQYSGDL